MLSSLDLWTSLAFCFFFFSKRQIIIIVSGTLLTHMSIFPLLIRLSLLVIGASSSSKLIHTLHCSLDRLTVHCVFVAYLMPSIVWLLVIANNVQVCIFLYQCGPFHWPQLLQHFLLKSFHLIRDNNEVCLLKMPLLFFSSDQQTLVECCHVIKNLQVVRI